jgi:hypothetical protein
MGTIRDRINDMLDDPLDLFNKAFDTPNPNLPPNSGTWLGHQVQAEGWQNGLQNLIDEAIKAGCPVPPGARKLAGRDLPKRPRGK